MKDREEVLSKIKHFRDVSVYFYMVSFFMITIMFVFYLIGSKNNRSCQYGSTLYCNTEKFYYTGFKENGEYLQIVFKQPTGTITAGTSYTLGYPYIDTVGTRYNIVYYFNEAAPANVTNILTGDNITTGISLNGTTGASIYFTNTSRPDGVTLNKMTEFVLLNSGITTFEILTPNVASPADSTLDYHYPTSNAGLQAITLPSTITSVDKFYSFPSGQTITWSGANPVKSNWLNLIKNNKDQHLYGCSSGNLAACACIDPSYTPDIMCNDLILNKDSGLYCPPEFPKCTEACTPSNAYNNNNCGYRFCSSGVVPNSFSDSKTTRQTYGKGSYQNAFIPGAKKSQSQDIYTVGYHGENLADNLAIASGWTSGDVDLVDYAQVQRRTMCGGTLSTNNNIDDSTTTTGINIKSKSTLAANSYTPQFGVSPNFSLANKFNF